MYDLEFLIEQLPKSIQRKTGVPSTAKIGLSFIKHDKLWECKYWKTRVYFFATSPLEAAITLAIELFKAGVLERKPAQSQEGAE